MDAVKVRKPKMSERNQLVWTEPNFKFVREHSISRPKPSWISEHPKPAIVIMLIVFAALFTELLFEYNYVRIPLVLVFAVGSIFLCVDSFLAASRADKFRIKLLKRGGEIINPWNSKMLKTDKSVNIMTTISIGLFVIYIVVVLIIYAKGSDNATNMLFVFYFPITYSTTFSSNQYIYSPYIFMDIDEGMLFGDALFPYDIMSGLKPTGNGNGFELYYEGKKVAYGRMLPDDMSYLQEILALRSKYKDYLTE